MTHIAFVSEHASPLALRGSVDAGGQNVYIDELSRNLGRMGYGVDVFTRRDRPGLPEVISWAPNVRLVNLMAGPPRPLLKDSLWPYMPTFRDAFLDFMSRDGVRYDVLHGNFWMSGWVATQLRRRLDLPVVQIFHAMGKTKQHYQRQADTSPRERIAVELQIVREVDSLIAQCPSERAELVDDYGADPARVSVIPSAVNTELYRPIERDEARRRIGLTGTGPVVVYVGRMLPRKDIRNVVRGLAALIGRHGADAGTGDGPVQLLLVGGETAEPDPVMTPEIGVLQELAAELGIAHHLAFVGKRQPDELCNYYSAGDVVVTTPWYEPFGLTPLEAMACGRPVVGSAVGGITYTIADGETGYLVPPRDPDALAQRLHALLSQPALRQAMGMAARRRVETLFRWPTVAERTAALYETCLRRVIVPSRHALAYG